MYKLLNIVIATCFLLHGYTSFATNYYVNFEYIIPHDTISVCNQFACEYDIVHYWIEENQRGPLDFTFGGIRRFDTVYNWAINDININNNFISYKIFNKNDIYINIGESAANCIDGGFFGLVSLFNVINNDTFPVRSDNGTSPATAFAVFQCSPIAKYNTNTNTTICQNTCVSFTDSSLYRPRHWQWQIYNTANEIIYEDTLQNIHYCFADTGTFFIKQKVWNAEGADSTTKYIKIIPSPIIINDTTQTITLSNTTETELEACATAEQYEWFPKENLSCTTCNFTTATINADASYYCVASNFNGCKETCFYNIIAPFDIFVPNAFTPNNDGINDIFRVHGVNIEVQNCVIYNRFGNEVYNGNLQNGWNGTYKNEPLENGVYAYLLKYLNKKTNSVISKSGNFTIIR